MSSRNVGWRSSWWVHHHREFVAFCGWMDSLFASCLQQTCQGGEAGPDPMTASDVTVDVFFGTARGGPGRALLWQSVRQHRRANVGSSFHNSDYGGLNILLAMGIEATLRSGEPISPTGTRPILSVDIVRVLCQCTRSAPNRLGGQRRIIRSPSRRPWTWTWRPEPPLSGSARRSPPAFFRSCRPAKPMCSV